MTQILKRFKKHLLVMVICTVGVAVLYMQFGSLFIRDIAKEIALIFLLLFCLVGVPVIASMFVESMRGSAHVKRVSKVFDLQTSFEKLDFLIHHNIHTHQGINEIFLVLSEIECLIEKLKDLRKSFQWNHEVIVQFQKTFDATFQYLMPVVESLRRNLLTCMSEQQKLLRSVKSEVESTIIGSSELNQVAELQKARLDRQIEQFEELQRVLLKV